MSTTCTSCGNQLAPLQKFCTKCGAKQVESPAIPVQNSAPAIAAVPRNDDSVEIDALKFELNEAKKALQQAKEEASNHKRLYTEASDKLVSISESTKRTEQQLSAAKTEIQALQKELSNVQNKSIEPPFPDSVVATIRDFLGQDGEIDQKEIDMVYVEARSLGISDARTKSRLVVEVDRVKRAIKKETAGSEKPKRKIWRRLLVFLIVIIAIGGLLVAAFIFQDAVLDTMDSWGLHTTALRNILRGLN